MTPATPLPPPSLPAAPTPLYVDDWLLIVAKPAGLLAVAGRGPAGVDNLHARLCAHWPDALVVHRLDMSTSGLMVFARGATAQRRLSTCFAQRRVDKEYVAIVAGQPQADQPGDWSVIDLPLMRDWPARPKQMVDTEHGRPSLTQWRRAGDAPGPWGTGTRLTLRPVTGRTHQLRVHLAAIGHPIIGDALYAGAALAASAPRLLLHAAHLALPHPDDGRVLNWHCPPDF